MPLQTADLLAHFVRAHPSTPSVRVAPKSSSSVALEGERKTVTALFADIKRSTEFVRFHRPRIFVGRPVARSEKSSRNSLKSDAMARLSPV